MYFESYDKGIMYSAIINNSLIDSMVVNELISRGRMDNPLDIYGFLTGKESKPGSEGLTGLTDRTRARVNDTRAGIGKIRDKYVSYEKIITANNIMVITSESEYYPKIWDGLTGMPKVLYLRGDPGTLSRIDHNGSVSVVGSRDPGRYAVFATRQFVKELTGKGIVIVSGMAIGIDRTAHEEAMNNKGMTLAVLPAGCEKIYPPQNRDIYEKIIGGGGAVLSEMPPDTEVKKQYFPSRNRLISALSDCCLIMEAGEYSGTLHTASFAANQGRDLFVLPNNIYADNCIGGLKLINDGASILLKSDEVIDSVAEKLLYRKMSDSSLVTHDSRAELNRIRQMIDRTPEDVSDDDVGKVILDELQVRHMTCDELAGAIKIPFYRISGILSDLELKGQIFTEKGKFALTIAL